MRPKDVLLHFRLHWQAMLAPLFLWGFLVSGGEFSTRFWLVFLIFHILFYGGATALNSYYDEDEGPVGGLWEPPKVTQTLFVVAVGAQALGLILVLFISRPLFVLALIMGVVGTAYSHPSIRLKSRPWTSLLAVSIFQGMGGTAAGWLCCQNDWTTLFSVEGLLSLAATSLVITGFYPLTQIYQREQDQLKGDISFAVRWGERCFPLAVVCYSLAAGMLGFLSWRLFGLTDALVVVFGLLGLAALVVVWWVRYDDSQVRKNYVWMIRLGFLMTGGFLSFISYQLLFGR